MLFCGENVTEIVQFALAGNELPQLFVWANAVLEIEMLDMFSATD